MSCVLQDSIDEHDIPKEMRHRIMTFYRHKYRGGQYWHHESILRELPYDMQVILSSLSAIGVHYTTWFPSSTALSLRGAWLYCIPDKGYTP